MQADVFELKTTNLFGLVGIAGHPVLDQQVCSWADLRTPLGWPAGCSLSPLDNCV